MSDNTQQHDTRVMTISDFFKNIEEQTHRVIETIQAMHRFYPGIAPDVDLPFLKGLEEHCTRQAREFKDDLRVPTDFQKRRWNWGLPKEIPL